MKKLPHIMKSKFHYQLKKTEFGHLTTDSNFVFDMLYICYKIGWSICYFTTVF
jgi:hypothetical protein